MLVMLAALAFQASAAPQLPEALPSTSPASAWVQYDEGADGSVYFYDPQMIVPAGRWVGLLQRSRIHEVRRPAGSASLSISSPFAATDASAGS